MMKFFIAPNYWGMSNEELISMAHAYHMEISSNHSGDLDRYFVIQQLDQRWKALRTDRLAAVSIAISVLALFVSVLKLVL